MEKINPENKKSKDITTELEEAYKKILERKMLAIEREFKNMPEELDKIKRIIKFFTQLRSQQKTKK